jgi:hypothetical protein
MFISAYTLKLRCLKLFYIFISGIFAQTKNFAGLGDGLDDFSELPPNQRRKKLQSKLDALTSKICQETAARDGLMKMKTVYEANPALGDPMSIQGQLTENGQILDKLRSDLRKYQVIINIETPEFIKSS